MNLFLPFTPAGEKTELAAIEVKRRLGLGPYAAVDPFDVLAAVPARLVSLDSFPPVVRRALTSHGSAWSAIGYGKSPADGHDLILLNPLHHNHRRRASLMEELVHVVLDHPKVRLDFSGNGRWRRPFEKEVEDEAYNVGAACMIPYRELFNALKHEGLCLEGLAARYDVSTRYIHYRINRAGLHRVYAKACRSR